jgi:hypothetical protein
MAELEYYGGSEDDYRGQLTSPQFFTQLEVENRPL